MIFDTTSNAIFLNDMDVWVLTELLGLLAHATRSEGDLGARSYVRHKYEKQGLEGEHLEKAVDDMCNAFDLDDTVWHPGEKELTP